jgi:C1A family cysteine protease
MKAVLADGYPIAIGFTVYESFESEHVTSTGIVPLPRFWEQPVGGHAVLIVGYDNRRNWFIVRNSWGASWGMSATSYGPHGGNGGYCVMPYNYLTNRRLASDFWTAKGVAIPKKP